MQTRRGFLSRSGLGLAATAGLCLGFQGDGGPAAGDPPDERVPDGSAAKGMIDERTDEAIRKSLAYLASNRHKDGSFGTGGYRGNVAVTALGGMAMMCGGHQPGRGTYGKVVLDALRFVLSQENVRGAGEGYLYNPNASPHGPMYGHGFATLFVSEAYGMVHEKALRDETRTKLHAAVKLIIRAQNKEGGWRYTPTSTDADLSVAVCQIMALRSARNAGIFVPKPTVDKCTEYVKGCQEKSEGWFRYMKHGGGFGGTQGFARTAAGVCALYAAGIYKGEEVEKGLKFLLRNKPGGRGFRPDLHYFYGHYYAVQAMWTAGGDYWKEWFPAIRDELLDRQDGDGSWRDSICGHYGTAMAAIILQVPNNYLPILQK
ncbi:MAG: terpene cyclase/mutase family protein [Gemmataceae bacterium]|nr:terpene cyclase/mutase family protein [Gemmataceae bacterium]